LTGRPSSNLVSRSDSQRKFVVDSRNGKSQVEEADELATVPAEVNADVRFVGAPKAYGLGHNLQGHVVPVSSSLEKSSGRTTPYQSDAEGSNLGRPCSFLKSGVMNGEGSGGR